MPPTSSSGIDFDWSANPHLAETIGAVWNMVFPIAALVIAVLIFAILFDHILISLANFLKIFFYGDSDSTYETDGDSDNYSSHDDGPAIENVFGSNVRNTVRGNQIDEVLWDRPKGFSFPTFSLPQFFKPGLAEGVRPGFNQAESYSHNQAELYGSQTGSNAANQANANTNQPELYQPTSTVTRLVGGLPEFLRPNLAVTPQTTYQADNLGVTSETTLSPSAGVTPQTGLTPSPTVSSTIADDKPSSLTDRYPMLRLARLTGWLTK